MIHRIKLTTGDLYMTLAALIKVRSDYARTSQKYRERHPGKECNSGPKVARYGKVIEALLAEIKANGLEFDMSGVRPTDPYDAGYSSLPSAENPYRPGSIPAREWDDGRRDAERHRNEAGRLRPIDSPGDIDIGRLE